MAVHMMMERMRPLEPSSAPAVMSSLLSSTKPIATAERPAYEFRIEITVGMSAPPIGMMSNTPKISDRTLTTGKRLADAGAVGFSTTYPPTASGHQQQAEVHEVLARIGDRTLRDPLQLLQLAGGDEAAGEGQVAEHDLEHDRDHPEGGEVLGALGQPEVVLGGADEPGGRAAERVRERGPLRHRGQRHLRERHADHEAEHDRDHDPGVVDDLGLRPGGEHGDHHAADAGVHAVPRGLRIAHPMEREDEERGRDEVRELDQRMNHLGAALPPASRVLNILSMRLVMRKPLTMLVIEAKSATAPRKRMWVG